MNEELYTIMTDTELHDPSDSYERLESKIHNNVQYTTEWITDYLLDESVEDPVVTFPLKEVDNFVLEAIKYNQRLNKRLKKATFPFNNIHIARDTEYDWRYLTKVYHCLKTSAFTYDSYAISVHVLTGSLDRVTNRLDFKEYNVYSEVIKASKRSSTTHRTIMNFSHHSPV